MSMRLGIVAEFTNRASKRMEKLLRVNARLEKATRVQTKLAKTHFGYQTKLAAVTERLSGLFMSVKSAASGMSAPIIRAAAAMARFTGKVSTAIRKVFSLRAALDRARSGAALMGKGLGRLGKGAMAAGGLALGAGGLAAGAANMVIGPAAQNEAYIVQLEALEGSAQKARTAMEWIAQFELTTPLELPAIIEAYRQLRTFGINPTNGSLQALVDTMAMGGGGAENLSGIILAVGQAWTKGRLQGEEALQLLERGVPVWDLLSNATGRSAAQLQEMASKGQLGRDVISKLVELMGERAAGASQKMAMTWNGMISTMSSYWWKFRLMIAEAGVFEFAKDQLQGLLDTINTMAADGSLLTLAQTVADNIITTLENLWHFGVEAYAVFETLGGWLSYAADMLGGWNNLAMVLIGLPLAGTLMSIVTGVVQLASGLMMLASGLAVLSLPVAAVIAGVAALAAGAWYLYNNWDQVITWFAGAWDGLKNLFSWSPLEAMSTRWSALSSWFSSVWKDLKATAQEGWNTVVATFDIAWPEWPNLSFPDFSTLKQSLVDFFSLDWLPEWTWPDLSFPAVQDLLGTFDRSAVRGAVAALFTFDWPEWPDLPKLSLPDFSALKQSVIDFFSLEWLPAWQWPEIPLPPLPDLSGMISDVSSKASAAWNGLTGLFSDADPMEIAVRDPRSLERAQAAVDGLRSSLDAVQGAVDGVNQVLAAADFTHHGARLMETIAAGMRSRAHVVIEEMRRLTQSMRDYLPSSPAKVGPLSDIHRLKFSETMAQSIRPEPMVAAMRRTAAATMAAATLAAPNLASAAPTLIRPPETALAVQAGGTNQSSGTGSASSGISIHINYNPTIAVEGGAVDEAQIRDLLEEHADQLAAMLKDRLSEDKRLEF